MKLLLEWLTYWIQLIKKHPIKVGMFAIISIVITVFYQYAIQNPLLTFGNARKAVTISDEERDFRSIGTKSSSNKVVVKNAQRSRLLLRIRKQFDVACRSFLPTLRKRIFETIDVSNTIRQIKEIRLSGQQFSDAENDLWEDVKISSFGQLLATLYLLSAVCTLLRIQLHVLARHLAKGEKPASPSTSMDSSDDVGLDNEMFKVLVEGTYRQMFGRGLQTFSVIILDKLRSLLADWKVKDKVKVDFEEMKSLFETIRRQIETNFELFVKDLFLPPEAETGLSPIKASPVVQKLLNQIWDIVDSSVFQVVYLETLDTCYRIAYEHLRKLIFQPENSPISGYSESTTISRSPPLASILPQLKSISNRLLPDIIDLPLNNDLKTLSSGALLDSLCISIFDADEE